MGVPPAFAFYPLPGHGVVPAENIFDRPGHDVMDAWHPVGRRGPFVEDIAVFFRALLHAAVKDLLRIPKRQDFLVDLGEIQGFELFVHVCLGCQGLRPLIFRSQK